MEFKVVISDPDSGKSYQREIKDAKATRFRSLNVGDEFDGSAVGLSGYTLKITGGSDKSGFPMKKGVHGTQKPRILMKSGVGYKPKGDVRKRKRVRGERIDEDIVQINTKVIKRAKKGIEEMFGLKAGEETDEGKAEVKEAAKAEEEKEEAKEMVKEEAKEVVKEEVKEEKTKEKPKEKEPKKTHEAKAEEKPPADENPPDKKSKEGKSEEKSKTEQ